MKKRNVMVVAAGVVALLVAGGLFASNMGFKLNYLLAAQGTNGSATGLGKLGLPYNQQTSLVTASDLRNDIGAGAVISISKFLASTNGLQTYTGANPATDFNLVPGEGYTVQVNTDVNYIIVGSHDPGLIVNMDAAGTNGSATGLNDFAPPYHATSAAASGLRDEINAASGSNAVISISRFIITTNGLQTYTGANPATDFNLVPGESYTIQVNTDVAYIPSHY